MKKTLILFPLALLALAPAEAQEGNTVFQKREVIIIDEEKPASITGTVIIRNDRTRRRMNKGWSDVEIFNQIGLGYNGLVADPENLELPAGYDWLALKTKSINFNLMLASGQYNLTRHLGLHMGLELEVNNYRFEEDVTLRLDEQGHIAPDWRFSEAGGHLKKTKLVNSFFNVPLTLQIGIGRRDRVRLYGGVVGGWRWNSYTKLKADNELLDGKERYRENFNLRNFHYGYTAGLAIHNIGVYATYYPHSIFKKGDADIRQVNVGLLLRY